MKSCIKPWRISLAALAISIAVCGCTADVNIENELPEAKNDSVKTLTLSVESGLSDAAVGGMECFVRKVAEISGGSMCISVKESDDLLSDIDNGCELAFGSNSEFARANGNFESYASPFYFYDYKHLALTLNSQSFYDIIRDTNVSLMNAMPIGAFYDGNKVILSSRDEIYDTVSQYDGSVVNITESPIFEEVLKAFGASVKERSDEYMALNFGRNRDNSVMEMDTLSLDELALPEDVTRFYVCETFHRARINWLVLSENARKSLSSRELAVITEAVAYAVAQNDDAVLKKEQEQIDAVKEMGASVVVPSYSEFVEATESALRKSVRYGGLWDWSQYTEIRSLAIRQS